MPHRGSKPPKQSLRSKEVHCRSKHREVDGESGACEVVCVSFDEMQRLRVMCVSRRNASAMKTCRGSEGRAACVGKDMAMDARVWLCAERSGAYRVCASWARVECK
jgi:hypothetical protein